MREFRAQVTGEISHKLYLPAEAYDTLQPGMPLRLHANGTVDPPDNSWELGKGTITHGNYHQMYICQSWRDSVTREGNQMLAMIPLSIPFKALAIVEADDFADVADIGALTAGTTFAYIENKLTPTKAGNPPIMQLLKTPKRLFNDEWEIEVATWGLRHQEE